MTLASGLDGRLVPVRSSRGREAVLYFERWEDNVLPPPSGETWPPQVLRQVNAYVAHKSWFSAPDADALAARLGRISKFQSINSEDAVTWSWFGTLGLEPPSARRRALAWLYERIGLDVTASERATIDQWRRVVHPNALHSARGPEVDALIDDPRSALIYVEAKWNAGVGTGKGAAPGARDDQIVLRRDALRIDPTRTDDDRELVVLCIANRPIDLRLYDERPQAARWPVKVASLTWDELASCSAHPRHGDFAHYLDWKRMLATPP